MKGGVVITDAIACTPLQRLYGRKSTFCKGEFRGIFFYVNGIVIKAIKIHMSEVYYESHSEIRAALAQHLGKPAKASAVHRLLERHGWRKVSPDTHHSKSDPAAQEEWKKTSGNTGGLTDPRKYERASSPLDVPR
jgi:hypothetical protein